MSKISIQALDNGPFHVKGDAVLLDGEGKTMDTTSELYLCRCGLSKIPHTVMVHTKINLRVKYA